MFEVFGGGTTLGVAVESNQFVIRPNEVKRVNVLLSATGENGDFIIKGNNPLSAYGSKTPFFVKQDGVVVIGGERASSSGDTFGS